MTSGMSGDGASTSNSKKELLATFMFDPLEGVVCNLCGGNLLDPQRINWKRHNLKSHVKRCHTNKYESTNYILHVEEEFKKINDEITVFASKMDAEQLQLYRDFLIMVPHTVWWCRECNLGFASKRKHRHMAKMFPMDGRFGSKHCRQGRKKYFWQKDCSLAVFRECSAHLLKSQHQSRVRSSKVASTTSEAAKNQSSSSAVAGPKESNKTGQVPAAAVAETASGGEDGNDKDKDDTINAVRDHLPPRQMPNDDSAVAAAAKTEVRATNDIKNPADNETPDDSAAAAEGAALERLDVDKSVRPPSHDASALLASSTSSH